MSATTKSRRLLVALGMVGGPLCIALGNALSPQSDGSAAQQLAVVHAHEAAFLTASVLSGAGFALLGALGVGAAMLLPGRGGRFATAGAVLTLLGGITMGGAVVTQGFVEAALPDSQGAALDALQQSPLVGALFDASYLAAIGGLLLVIGLLIGRPVRIWIPILLLVGMVLSMAGGGLLGAALGVPLVVAVALLAGALLRTAPAEMPAASPRVRQTARA